MASVTKLAVFPSFQIPCRLWCTTYFGPFVWWSMKQTGTKCMCLVSTMKIALHPIASSSQLDSDIKSRNFINVLCLFWWVWWLSFAVQTTTARWKIKSTTLYDKDSRVWILWHPLASQIWIVSSLFYQLWNEVCHSCYFFTTVRTKYKYSHFHS